MTSPPTNAAPVTLDVLLMADEDGQVVAYCPALELSSYGDDEADALAAFREALAITLEDTTQRGTLEKLLHQLGWRMPQPPAPTYEPLIYLRKTNKRKFYLNLINKAFLLIY